MLRKILPSRLRGLIKKIVDDPEITLTTLSRFRMALIVASGFFTASMTTLSTVVSYRILYSSSTRDVINVRGTGLYLSKSDLMRSMALASYLEMKLLMALLDQMIVRQ
jgi:hypothetical protein